MARKPITRLLKCGTRITITPGDSLCIIDIEGSSATAPSAILIDGPDRIRFAIRYEALPEIIALAGKFVKPKKKKE